MNSHPLSGDYLRWLAPQIRGEDDGNPDRTYGGLVDIMHQTEFIWMPSTPNDDNRIGDGMDLRVEFCREHDISPIVRDELGFCTFLEVLIGLSRRLEWNAGGTTAPSWAWQLVRNLGLDRYSDPVGRGKTQRVHDILETCIYRTYEANGQGGFFPLRNPREDQRPVELWYQMAAYLDDQPPRR